MKKSIFLNIIKWIGIFLGLILIYIILLLIVSSFPSKYIKNHVAESADFFVENTKSQSEIIQLPYKFVNLFHFTNALMINTAYSIDSTHPLEAALTAKKNYIPNITTTIYTVTPKDLQSASKYYDDTSSKTDAYQVEELYDTVYENDLTESFEYARYWHGYLVFLRPLLLFLNYKQISILMLVLFLGLLGGNCYLLAKKSGIWSAVALVFAYLLVDTLFVTRSLNEITCFILALIFSIGILLRNKKSMGLAIYFFLIGSITNFVDFLTNPIITYGMPITMFFIVNEEKSMRKTFKIYFQTAIAWAIGYGLTWGSKWVITDLVLHRNIISNAIEQILFRTNDNSYNMDLLVERVQFYLSNMTIFIIGIVLVIFAINPKREREHNDFLETFPFFIAILIPIVWYMVVLNHSIVHTFFTYRNMIVSIFALEIFALKMANRVKKGID